MVLNISLLSILNLYFILLSTILRFRKCIWTTFPEVQPALRLRNRRRGGSAIDEEKGPFPIEEDSLYFVIYTSIAFGPETAACTNSTEHRRSNTCIMLKFTEPLDPSSR